VPVTGKDNGKVKLKTDGTELIMTAVAWLVALSCKPSISPVTMPGVLQPKPPLQGKEKSKLSAWPGVDASANAEANANAAFFVSPVSPDSETKLGSPLQRGRPVSVDPHSYMDRSPARESKDDRRSRASIGMRSRIFAMGNRRMIVAAAGLCMTAFFHRSGGDLRRSRIRSNDSNARRHDRRAVWNVILVTQQQLQGVGAWFECDLRLGLSSTEMKVIEVIGNRLVQRRQISID
jgi:hypothetical protein